MGCLGICKEIYYMKLMYCFHFVCCWVFWTIVVLFDWLGLLVYRLFGVVCWICAFMFGGFCLGCSKSLSKFPSHVLGFV